MEPLIDDLRHVLRELAKSPGFGAAAALVFVVAVLALLAPLAFGPDRPRSGGRGASEGREREA